MNLEKKTAMWRLRAAALVMLSGPVFSSCGDNGKQGDDVDVDVDAPVDIHVDPDLVEDPVGDPVQDDPDVDDVFPDGPSEPDIEPDVELDPDMEEEIPAGCEDAIAAIASETGIVGSCTAIVRLDYTTKDLIGWQLACGPYTSVNEASARTKAQEDTGYGASGTMLNAADPQDEYVFYQAPGDFGGAAAVSARNGLSVFGGSIIWMGTGDINYPAAWRPVEDLGSDCPPLPYVIGYQGYDLGSGGTTIDPSVADAILDIIWSTALPEGMATSGYLFDAVILLYPRSVGAFDPSTAEWIVLLNGGWLE